jgi:hypothetical protein
LPSYLFLLAQRSWLWHRNEQLKRSQTTNTPPGNEIHQRPLEVALRLTEFEGELRAHLDFLFLVIEETLRRVKLRYWLPMLTTALLAAGPRITITLVAIRPDTRKPLPSRSNHLYVRAEAEKKSHNVQLVDRCTTPPSVATMSQLTWTR